MDCRGRRAGAGFVPGEKMNDAEKEFLALSAEWDSIRPRVRAGAGFEQNPEARAFLDRLIAWIQESKTIPEREPFIDRAGAIYDAAYMLVTGGKKPLPEYSIGERLAMSVPKLPKQGPEWPWEKFLRIMLVAGGAAAALILLAGKK